MTFFVALALQVATQSVPDAVPLGDASEDITVIGNKLRKLQLDLGLSEGKLAGCRVKVSSTDKFIDETACRSAYVCVRRGVRDSRGLLDCINQRVIMAVAEQRSRKEANNAPNQ